MTTLTSHTASGQALGYFFQFERALSWISQLPAGSTVGIETEDDVVATLLNGEKILEQDKNSHTSHPFIPSKVDLWKTLCIWQNALKNSEIDKNKTKLYLVTNKTSENSLAALLGNASNDNDIQNCIKVLREKASTLTGNAKLFADRSLEFGDTILSQVIKQISYKAGDGLFGDGLRKQLYSDLQLDVKNQSLNDSIINELIGWLFEQITSAWREKRPAVVSRDDFMREKITILTSQRQAIVDEILIGLGQIPRSEEKKQLENTYVKQLMEIQCDKDEILKAIHDYLNAVSKRTRLALDGYLTLRQLDELDRQLQSRWANIFKLTQLKNPQNTDDQRGKICYYETINCETSIGDYKLRNHFLVNGSYHALSNDLKVGWHPNFKVLLSANPLGIPKQPKDLKNHG
jgi:hypothetical protein